MWKPRRAFIPFRYDGHPNTTKEQTMSVTSANYVELAMRTQADQQKVLDRLVKLGPKAMQLDNAIRGLCNDCGELAEPVKAWIEYGKEDALDKVNMQEEVGDVLWRLAQICDALGFSIEDCMEANIRKLATRYGDKYSDVKAWNENRDRVAERIALGQRSRATSIEQPKPPLEDVVKKELNVKPDLNEHLDKVYTDIKERPSIDSDKFEDKSVVVKKQLGHSYTRYCSHCKIQPIHKTNSVGVCTDCFVKYGEPKDASHS